MTKKFLKSANTSKNTKNLNNNKKSPKIFKNHKYLNNKY